MNRLIYVHCDNCGTRGYANSEANPDLPLAVVEVHSSICPDCAESSDDLIETWFSEAGRIIVPEWVFDMAEVEHKVLCDLKLFGAL